MKTRTYLVSALSALLLAGCSGGGKSEKPAETPADSKPTPADEPPVASDEAVYCLDEVVPAGATTCLLDLNKGSDSYWSDSDGTNPGVAGCNQEYVDGSCEEMKPRPAFGEFCIDADRLVEFTAGPGECQMYPADVGKPEIVSCSAWCNAGGADGGRCEPDVPAQGANGACTSARCVCDAPPPPG